VNNEHHQVTQHKVIYCPLAGDESALFNVTKTDLRRNRKKTERVLKSAGNSDQRDKYLTTRDSVFLPNITNIKTGLKQLTDKEICKEKG